jgi:chemotaxis protein CheX
MNAISIEYINPFLAAAKNVCATSMNLDVIAGKPRLREDDERIWKSYRISAVINLSDAVTGYVLVSFSERVALVLASKLAGEEFATLDDNVRDALGEIANLIIGSAKKDLPSGLVSISTPKIVDTQFIQLPPGCPTILLPFETTVGRFILQIALKQQSQTAA